MAFHPPIEKELFQVAPRRRSNRLPPGTKDEGDDWEILYSLHNVDDYTAINSAASLAALQMVEAIHLQAEFAVARAERDFKAARAATAEAAWAFHEAVETAKAEVLAQFGIDSPEARAIGLPLLTGRRRARRRRSSSCK